MRCGLSMISDAGLTEDIYKSRHPWQFTTPFPTSNMIEFNYSSIVRILSKLIKRCVRSFNSFLESESESGIFKIFFKRVSIRSPWFSIERLSCGMNNVSNNA